MAHNRRSHKYLEKINNTKLTGSIPCKSDNFISLERLGLKIMERYVTVRLSIFI